MNENEKSTSTGSDAAREREAYFLRRADDLLAYYGIEIDDHVEKLEFLASDLEMAKKLFGILELPWGKIIPALHQSLLLYYERTEGRKQREKVREISAGIMGCAAFMATSGGIRKKMSAYTNQQISLLQELIRAKKNGPADNTEEDGSQ